MEHTYAELRDNMFSLALGQALLERTVLAITGMRSNTIKETENGLVQKEERDGA